MKMAILSFYFYKGLKHNRIAIQTIYFWPTDWGHLRTLLVEVATKIWHEHHENQNMIVSLERHLPGKYSVLWAKNGYNTSHVRIRRSIEFSCILNYNPLNRKLSVKAGAFGPHLMNCLYDYRTLERKLTPKIPPVLPKPSERATGDLRLLLLNPSNSFHTDYSKIPNLSYDTTNSPCKQFSYQKMDTRIYMPKGSKIMEEDSETKGK
jgi:hypothetical protein